ARSTRDLLNTLAVVTDKGAGFKVLDQPALDTTSAHGKLLLNILGSIAEFERELIKSRTGEGRLRAKARGVKADERPWINPFLGELHHHRTDHHIEPVAAQEDQKSPQHADIGCAGHMRLIGLACGCSLGHAPPPRLMRQGSVTSACPVVEAYPQ